MILTRGKAALIALTLALPTIAQAETLNCTVLKNSEKALSQKVEALPGALMHFGEVDSYAFMVRNLGDASYELQIFDPSTPSRSYAQGTLRSPKDKVSWSFWSRDILLDVSCELATRKR